MQEPGLPPAAAWREAFEQQATAVLEAALGLRAGGDARSLAETVEACSRAGGAGGLKGLRYVESLLVPALRVRTSTLGLAEVEALEAWSHLLLAFACGGLEPDEAPGLLSGLSALADFPAPPESFETMIVARLREDARALGHADDPRAPAGPLSCARDELDLLASEMQRFGDEVCPLLLAIEDDASAPGARTARDSRWDEVIEEIDRELRQLQEAVGYLGLLQLAQWCAHVRHQLEAVGARAGAPAEELRSLLLTLPSSLEGYFRAPDASGAAELAGMLTHPVWPVPMAADQAEALGASLAGLQIVESRSIAWRSEDIDADDLSLEIPADADAKVVDHLLRELPQLALAFSELIEALNGGMTEAIEPAQRVAHTLKGTANTVGVAGIANLTHQLEDLLQLLGRDAGDGSGDASGDGVAATAAGAVEELGAALMAAADCLADMCDAVASRGEPPPNAASVYGSIVRWTNRLLARGASSPIAGTAVPGLREMGSAVSEAPARQSTAPQSTATGSPAPQSPATEARGTESPSSAVRPEPEPARALPAEADAIARVPVALIERLLELTGEAAIRLAQAQESAERLVSAQRSLRVDGEQLESLAWELDRLVDLRGAAMTGREAGGRDPTRPGAARRTSGFDPLELDEYNELHMVARRIAEAGADNKLLDTQIAAELSGLREALAGLERLNAEVHEAAFQARLVPVASVVPRLRRALRQAARLAGKEVMLLVEGENTQVDDDLLQRLLDPLMHLLRNAVDHGIETAALREALGKPAQGKVVLRFERRGGTLLVQCHDDGRGLDLEAIAARAVQRGVLRPEEGGDASRLMRLIFAAGFSTRETANQLSGRGIGLDVVQQRVSALGGGIDVEQVPGDGVRFTLTLPERLATIPVMVARAAGHVLAVVPSGIRTIAGAGEAVASSVSGADGAETIVLGGQRVPVVRLERLLGLPERLFERDGARAVLVIVDGPGGVPLAVVTPELAPTRHVLLRPLAPYLARVPGVDGVVVLGDGSVASVLDIAALVAARDAVPPPRFADEPVRMNVPVCLVVDDSVSVRRSTELFARDLGFEVDTAGDGMEALARVERRVPDLVIVDLEMPRMNGVEFTAALRKKHPGRAIPVIMITSRYSDKHRRLAAEAGVDVFLTKPYTDDDLATHIHRSMQRRAA